jgi:uncharacterized integral membrane protein (TIGR00698 family)
MMISDFLMAHQKVRFVALMDCAYTSYMDTTHGAADESEPRCSRWLIPLGALVCLLPFVSAAVALAGGIVLALTLGNPFEALTRKATHQLLAVGVVGLGAGMDLKVVAAVGLHGLGYTLAGIAVCLGLGLLLRRWLGVSRPLAVLITVGTAICGGSAIAAVVPVLRPKDREVSIALGTVFLFNAVALVAFPLIGHRLSLTPGQFGLWSALAIHDTSSVIGAALAFGGKAVEIATTVKLGRALWIVPVTLAISLHQGKHGAGTRRPWFILGFLTTAALVTFLPSLQPAGQLVTALARRLLVVTLFLIGTSLTRQTVRSVGLRPLAMGGLLWVAMSALTLGAIVVHLIQ